MNDHQNHIPGATPETGQLINPNGGQNIRLKDVCATSHHAILWGGGANLMGQYNDIANIRAALISQWGPLGENITINTLFGDGIHKPDGTDLPADWHATPATLDDLDTTAGLLRSVMGPGEQFLFYASGHGTAHISARRPLDGASGSSSSPSSDILPPGGQLQESIPLSPGMLDGLLHYNSTAPSLAISYTGSLDSSTAVSVTMNSVLLGHLQPGMSQVTFNLTPTLALLNNQVVLTSTNSVAITINQEELSLGNINNGLENSCPLSFTDVQQGSTFYNYVRCLSCLGIVSGYSDGTFRPNNNVTRGQLSKIVSNAAGFSEAQNTQLFQDVPISSTFQVFVGHLASRGFINGYPCGGPGEPCVDPGHLPYFRPNNNATRGQISKIDSNSASFSDVPSGHQFEDVTAGSTYYTYTYRLVSRSIMSGYPCGGVGEPCVSPSNLPYFRPNSNATRGQTAKIVANTFYPNCQTPADVRK